MTINVENALKISSANGVINGGWRYQCQWRNAMAWLSMASQHLWRIEASNNNQYSISGAAVAGQLASACVPVAVASMCVLPW
jgi:hypothetical protein